MNVKSDDPESTRKRNLPAFQGIGSVIKTKEKVVKGVVKTQEAEAKRQNALEEKWKTLQNQKFAIANALKGESLNKRIKFDDDGDQQKNDLQLSKQKISLFDDDDASDHENQGELVPDFKLKLRFEGEKGKKLFHMQTAKATGDDRFVMDKRFFEEQETTEKLSDDEIEKQMNILEDVIGRSITKPNKAKGDEIFNMVRYDPTQEEHKKYVKDKPELPKQKRPKKQKVEQNKVVAEAIVDTDKYYKVGDKLKDVFNSQNQFSFTSLFQTSDKIDDVDKNEYQSEKITKPQKKFGRNPFIDDSSDSENEENDLEDKNENFSTETNEVPSGKFLGSRGVWREVFFFKVDDSRFKDAEEFYDPQFNKTNYSGSQDPRFIKKRDLLRDFLKNKDKRHKRDVGKKMFSRKLGGTHNDNKKDKSHKNKPTIKTKKNNEGKKLKSSKTS
ncbi:probable RNA-binding protein CG14230 [Aphis gossypii]|uniref:probable RNA-binding protein CG14230 n=1 Tax=Aphis gossypii TaxID=80765 RepID=UPI00100F0805|nr:probable RNA-binding protein CG14230 [Aphis gossypii]